MAGMTQTVPIGAISIGSPIINGGGSSGASINLERESFAGMEIRIESSYPTVAWPDPSTVSVPAESGTASFTIRTNVVTESISVTFTGYSSSGVLSPADGIVLQASEPEPGPA